MVYALELYRLHSPILHWLQHVRCRRPYPLLFHFLSLSSARSSSSSASLSLSLTHYVARSRCERVLFIQYRPVAVCSLVLRFQTSCAVRVWFHLAQATDKNWLVRIRLVSATIVLVPLHVTVDCCFCGRSLYSRISCVSCFFPWCAVDKQHYMPFNQN